MTLPRRTIADIHAIADTLRIISSPCIGMGGYPAKCSRVGNTDYFAIASCEGNEPSLQIFSREEALLEIFEYWIQYADGIEDIERKADDWGLVFELDKFNRLIKKYSDWYNSKFLDQE